MSALKVFFRGEKLVGAKEPKEEETREEGGK
jgi:hypothetical protein